MRLASNSTAVVYVGDAYSGTIAQVLRARAEATPDAPFVTFETTRLTYSAALARAEQAASALRSLGVSRGDMVALMLPNCLEFLDFWFGTVLLGAVLVPVNTGLKGDGLRYIVKHSDADVVVCHETLLETFDAAIPPGERPSKRFSHGAAAAGWTDVADLLKGSYGRPRWAHVQPDHLASILYTSGTTGLPKGVMNCHNAYVTSGNEFARHHVRLRSDDVLYTSLPLFHVNAQMLTTVASLVSGRPMVLAPRFSASRFFDDLREHDATVFNYIGAMLTMLFKQPQRSDDSDNRVRLGIGGAAPQELWRAFERRFDLTILEIYGLTETATYCLGSPPDHILVGKIGVPVSWAEVEIHCEDGSEASAGQAGEIAIRAKGPNILFQGYYKNAAATDEAIRRGWFHSGDRGRRDTDGYFVFIDRQKDSIRRRGENISSYEVERIVNDHPAVAESAAVGVPSDLGEEDVMIVIVPRDGSAPAPDELVAYCAERMAGFMVPRYIQFRSELPKTATQRVQKFVLRDEGIASAWDREAPATAS